MYADVKYEKTEELLFDNMKPVLELRIIWPVIEGNITKKAEYNFNSFYLENAKTANTLMNKNKPTNIANEIAVKNIFCGNFAIAKINEVLYISFILALKLTIS